MKIKPSQLYEYENEPVDERPSEFMNSASWSPVSNFHAAPAVLRRPLRPLRRGFTGVVLAALTLFALATVTLAALASLLRG